MGLQTRQRTPVEQLLARAAGQRLAWPVGLGAIIVFEAVLLHTVAATGVAPYFPRAFDQVQYLTECYRAYTAMATDGFAGLFSTLVEPRVQGWLLQLEAGALCLLTGPGRLPALDVNILHFAAYLGITATVIRRAMGEGIALAFLGLAVSAGTVTRLVGGAFDFRLDFAAQCAWGTLVGVLALSRGAGLRSWRVWALVLTLGEVFISLRTLGFVYLALTVVILIIAAPVALGSRCKDQVAPVRRRLLGALAIWLTTEAVFVSANWAFVWDYYVGSHITNVQQDLLPAELGIAALGSQLGFYPHSLIVDHIGVTGVAPFALTLVVSGLLVVGKLAASGRRASPGLAVGLNLRWAMWVLGTALAVPYAVLTRDPVRSDVVGGILVPSVVLLAVLGLAAASAGAGSIPQAALRRWLVGVGIAAVIVGVVPQAWGLLRRSPELAADTEIARASGFILELADSAQPQPGRRLVWAMDAHLDFAAAQVTRIFYFEQRGVWLDLVGGLGEGLTGSTLTREDVLTQAKSSDVLILTRRTSAAPPVYPYDLSIEAAQPELFALAADQFELGARTALYGRDVFGFVRRR